MDKLTDNEIISAWVFKNVKIMGNMLPATDYPPRPHYNPENKPFGWILCPDYSDDPAAWTPELYDLISERGLIREFVRSLRDIAYNVHESNVLFSFYMQNWAIAKATPEQKAQALARAIEEAG